MVAESAADDGVSLGDVVALLVGGGVAVGVRDKGVSRVDEVWLSSAHERGTGDGLDLAVLVVRGGVAEGEEHATAGPGEFVAERVVGALGGGETTAVGEEGGDFAALVVDLLSLDGRIQGISDISTYLGDGLDSEEMVNALGILVSSHTTQKHWYNLRDRDQSRS